MSVPAQTPVRLADAKLACGCEFILRPEGDDLSWLPRLADTLIRFAAAELRCEAAVILVMTADQNGQPHGKTGDNDGDTMHDLAAGGDAGYICRLGELPHHQQVYAAIHGLQKQCQKDGKRKTNQGRQNLSFGKILYFFHDKIPFLSLLC